MKKESVDTQNSYLLLQSEVEKCMGSATERNILIEVKSKRLKEELEKEEETNTVAAKYLEEINNEIEMDLKSLEKINLEFQAAEEAGRAYKRNFLGKFFLNSGNNERTGNQLEEMYGRKQKKQNSVNERLKELNEKRNQHLHKKKELCNMQAGLCNVESLRQAIIHLKDVDGRFKSVIQLWEDTATTLRSWEVNLKEIEIMQYAKQLKKYTRSVKKHCQIFGTIFTNYVKESDSNIIGLYNFLSRSIYHTSDSDREATQGTLI
ncbi:uncharacterized protein LOC127848610 isoform X2 [Dreissena polymorpha]|uniref:uncharacterized protein LOC127848610 isoform X2 n=1 Tax=Dreissena polymorpha TaxID=45954 RepID=UPI00226524F5|nr:uncharacterized protein LOC127848610 isoform X2 [Dreissena polymorpha]